MSQRAWMRRLFVCALLAGAGVLAAGRSGIIGRL